METKAKLISATRDFKSQKRLLTFEVDNVSDEELNRLFECETLSLKAVKHFKKRSKDANGLLWACLGEMAAALRTDKWDLYLSLLKQYGKYTYIVVKEEAAEAVKRQWRESEIIGAIEMKDANGNQIPAVQMLCYYGSSTYNSQEFSVLLDGVKYEMEQAGLEPPPSREMKRVIEQLEQRDDAKGCTTEHKANS